MNGSPMAAVIRGWVDLYTRGLPADARAARRDEIDDDLWCAHAEAAAAGRSARSLDADLALRLVFGIPADISWRLTYRGNKTAVEIERINSISTRILGVLAIVAGSSLGSLVILDRASGGAVWTSAAGVVLVVGLMIAFPAAAVGLARRFQDRIGPLGAAGAIMVALASVLIFANVASIAVLAVGSGLLMWDLARIGVLSRHAAITHLMTAILVIGLAVANLVEPGNALASVLISPFAVSWIVIGVSLIRGLPKPQATSG